MLSRDEWERAMSSKALELIFLRNISYQRQCYLIVGLIFFQLLVIGLQLYFITVQLDGRPKPAYFPTTPDGRYIDMIPISEPTLKGDAFDKWIMETAETVTSFDYINYKRDLQTMSHLFTAKGHRDYRKALQESNNLENVKVKRQVVFGRVTGKPKILDKYYYQGTRASWEIELPMTIHYQNAQDKDIRQPVTVFMTVMRVSTLKNPAGLAIMQFIY